MRRTIWLDAYTAAGIMAGRITRLCVPKVLALLTSTSEIVVLEARSPAAT